MEYGAGGWPLKDNGKEKRLACPKCDESRWQMTAVYGPGGRLGDPGGGTRLVCLACLHSTYYPDNPRRTRV